MAAPFTRLVRFQATDGKIYLGEAGDDWHSELEGRTVPVFSGSDPFDTKLHLSSDKTAVISKVKPADQIIYCHTVVDCSV